MSPSKRAPEEAPARLHIPPIDQIINCANQSFRRLAVMGAVGLLAVGGENLALSNTDPGSFRTDVAQAHGDQHIINLLKQLEHHKPVQPATPEQPVTPIQPSQSSQPKAQHNIHHRGSCTTFRIAANDIYAGSGCANKGTTAEIVDNGHQEKGWVYSAIVSRGVKKCFYVKKGKLPAPANSDPNLISTCRAFYPTLAEQKYTYLKKYNCKFLPGGLQACRSGTFYTPIASTCKRNVVYRNYATKDATPWNADGKAAAGLTEKVKNSEGRLAVSYRVQIKEAKNGNKAGAAVIRGLEESHGWGVMDPSCPKKNKLQGGTPTIQGKSKARR